jgi:SAM-dependent methyltransferase
MANGDKTFEFGRNWADYACKIDQNRIDLAQAGLCRLLGQSSLTGRSVLDIGCGSGIHSLAALFLGCPKLLAVDVDPNSVATTHAVLQAHAAGLNWRAERVSVFDLDPVRTGVFDVVYSWGVLHHTGDMKRAIRCAVRLVAPGGLFIIALYRKTPFCGFWRWEKRLYAKASPAIQKVIRGIYRTAYFLKYTLTGKNYYKYVRSCHERGMDFSNDIHDWLGGYPYESISPAEVEDFVSALGGGLVRKFVHPTGLGLLGSGCDEFVFQWPEAGQEGQCSGSKVPSPQL